MLSGASEGHALFRCGCIYFPRLTHPELYRQPGGQEETLCQTASCGGEAAEFLLVQKMSNSTEACLHPALTGTGCSDLEILLISHFPGVNFLNESVSG